MYHNKDLGTTILHYLAALGKNELLEVVLKKLEERLTPENLKIFLLCKGPEDVNPLHLAANNGHLQIIKTLLKYAEKTSKSTYAYITTVDKQMINAIHAAASKDHKNIVQFLLNKIPPQNMYHVLCFPNNDGVNVLHWSAYKGNGQLVKFILGKIKEVLSAEEIAAFLHLKTNNGLNALEVAKEEGHFHIVNILEQFPLYRI